MTQLSGRRPQQKHLEKRRYVFVWLVNERPCRKIPLQEKWEPFYFLQSILLRTNTGRISRCLLYIPTNQPHQREKHMQNICNRDTYRYNVSFKRERDRRSSVHVPRAFQEISSRQSRSCVFPCFSEREGDEGLWKSNCMFTGCCLVFLGFNYICLFCLCSCIRRYFWEDTR